MLCSFEHCHRCWRSATTSNIRGFQVSLDSAQATGNKRFFLLSERFSLFVGFCVVIVFLIRSGATGFGSVASFRRSTFADV